MHEAFRVECIKSVSGSITSHITREDDGTSSARWGPFILKSAFQPIFAFEQGTLAPIAYEALLRPFRGRSPLAPTVFLNALSGPDRIFMENLAHRLHLLNAAACLPPDAQIFVNLDPSVSGEHATADAAIYDISETLAETGIDPGRIVCEITEKEAGSREFLFALVSSLRSHGFRIAVDDYGAEESDMLRIRDLHPDIVKFDATWISAPMDSRAGHALLSAMVATFSKQGIRTVFEGIEESWQIELAEKAGVDMLQGFALARPELCSVAYAPGSKTRQAGKGPS